MSCECEAKYNRVLRSEITFKVYLSSDPASSPLLWKDNKLFVCTMCGNFTGQIPDDVLSVLRDGAGNDDTAG